MKRAIFQDLIQWKNRKNRKPLILHGVRQVGKTYLLKHFGQTSFPRFHYINLEKEISLHVIFETDFNPTRIVNELNFYLDTKIDIENDLVVFDEIQACPKALTSLKYFHEDMPSLAICAAGSLLGLHLNSTSYPVGKVDILKMYPLSFQEFLTGIEDEKASLILDIIKQAVLQTQFEIPSIAHEHLWEQLKLYFVIGGMPEVINIFSQYKENPYVALQEVRNKQLNLIHAYYADMAKHAGKVNAMHLDRIWRSIPLQLARAQDGNATKFKFKGVVPGIDRYSRLVGALDWLEAAGLVIKSHIVDQASLPLAAYTNESAFKLFMFDVGILGAMSELPPIVILEADYGSYKGYFAENFVAQSFLCNSRENLYTWVSGTSEIEFLKEVNGKIIPVEVKSGNRTQAKSLQVYIEKYHPSYAVLLSAQALALHFKQHVQRYPLYLAGQLPLI